MSTRSQQLPLYDSAKVGQRVILGLHELFRYRFLVMNIISRDLKVRYKRSVLGFLWVMMNPLLTMGVMTLVFLQLFKFNVPHYIAYLLSGILLMSLFQQGTITAMGTVVGNSGTLKKMYVPASAFVSGAVGSALVNFLFALGPFFLLALLTGVSPSVTWVFALIPALQTTMFVLGVGLVLAALTVFFNDIFEIYQVLINVYFYLTPVIYPVSILPEPLKSAEQWNPMFLTLTELRAAVLDGRLPSWQTSTLATALCLVVLAIGWILFARLERNFVYHI